MKTAISNAVRFLETAFDALNANLFNGELARPAITIQTTPRAYGHVSVKKIWNDETVTGAAHELNIGAEFLNRPVENLIATLVHEMVHLLNLKNGVQDCSRGNTYHNRKFKEVAEAHMLKITFDKRIGWSMTEPTDALKEFITGQGWEKLPMCRERKGKAEDGDNGKKSSSTRKYV